MTFLDKLGIKGKKNKASQPMGDEKKRNLERQVLEARTKLEEARMKNMNVIDMELRNIRYDRKHNSGAGSEARHIAKIKNAYYSMGMIDNTKLRLNDIETTNELFSAMNNMADAMKLINQIYQKSEKPKTGQLTRQSEKMEKNMEKSDERMGALYRNVENIDKLVSNDVVERLIKGARIDECLGGGDGIQIPMDELANMDWSNVRENQANSGTDAEDVDYSSMDYSDFKI